MVFIQACVKLFGKQDLYKILNVSRNASQEDVFRAYYRMAEPYHPDYVSDDNLSEAIEKFNVLGKIYSILSDPERRSKYDERGIWTEDEDDENKLEETDWVAYWDNFFVNEETIGVDHFYYTENEIRILQEFKNYYEGSAEEVVDLIEVYLVCKGNIDKIILIMPFLTYDDKDRIMSILIKLIEYQFIPCFEMFFQEILEMVELRNQVEDIEY